MSYSSRYCSDILFEAQRLVAAGLSVLPILPNGSKKPAVAWKPYQTRLPTKAELVQWFHDETRGMAAIGGAVSGCLEILDFDAQELFDPWSIMVETLCPGLLMRLPLSETPSNGRHVFYRCQSIAGNQKLAQRYGLEGTLQTLIETRGEGGYAIVPPSPSACHPAKRPYVLLHGDLARTPKISSAERTILLNAAYSFNEGVSPERVVVGPRTIASQQIEGDRPGDLFNRHAIWPDILEPHGWTRVGQRGEVTFWRRPGKRVRGSSATTNYAGSDLLYVFSSNAFPFDQDTAYAKFAAYVLLEHGGDFHRAARSLAPHRFGTHRGDEHHASLRIRPVAVAARQIRTITVKEVARWHG